MKHLIVALAIFAAGCGSPAFDAVSGNATLQNGVVNGSVGIRTPLGTFTFPAPAPSPQ